KTRNLSIRFAIFSDKYRTACGSKRVFAGVDYPSRSGSGPTLTERLAMKSRLNFVLLLIVVLSTFAIARAQDEYAAVKSWEPFDFAGKSVSSTDINALAI